MIAPHIEPRILALCIGMFGAPANPFIPLTALLTVVGYGVWEFVFQSHYDFELNYVFKYCPKVMMINTLITLGLQIFILIPLDNSFINPFIAIGVIFILSLIGQCVYANRFERKTMEQHNPKIAKLIAEDLVQTILTAPGLCSPGTVVNVQQDVPIQNNPLLQGGTALDDGTGH